MSKDIVIYDKNTRIIFGIITNTSLKDCRVILNNNLEVVDVDNSKDYITIDDELKTYKFKNPDSKVLYLDDYRKRG